MAAVACEEMAAPQVESIQTLILAALAAALLRVSDLPSI